MEQPPDTSKRDMSRRWRIKWAIITVAAIISLGVLGILVTSSDNRTSADALARQWVNDEVDHAGEAIAGWLVQEQPILKEIGGEYLEDRINDVVVWEFSPAVHIRENVYDVRATARVTFDLPLAGGNVEAAVPWVIRADEANEVVTVEKPCCGPQWTSASLQVNSVGLSVEDAEKAIDKLLDSNPESIGGALDKLRKGQ